MLSYETSGQLLYRAEYKYQLDQDWWGRFPELIGVSCAIVDQCDPDPWAKLYPDGRLVIKAGYCCDGPSGPTIDTKDFMRGAVVHDVLYQMMRAGLLEQYYRKTADQILINLCKQDGMPFWRRWYVYWAVRVFGSCRAKKQKQTVFAAP